MSKIRVIDAPCGAGKTTSMIEYLHKQKGAPYIYISPFKDTVKDIAMKLSAKSPPRDGNTKKQNFLEYLEAGENIVATHQLFLRCSEDDLNIIRAKGYTLIIDEALDVLQKFNSVVNGHEAVKKGTIDQWLNNGQITVDEKTNLIKWNDKEYPDHNFPTFINAAKYDALLYINGNILLWHFPPKALQIFENIFVLTYRFESSFLRCYFDLYGFGYNKSGIWVDGCGFSEFVHDTDSRQKYKILIRIYEGTLNDIGNENYALSANWQRKRQNTLKKQLCNNIRNYFEHIQKADSADVMWTTYKNNTDDDDFAVEGKKKTSIPVVNGYSKRFVTSTSKATNDYRTVPVLAYGINKFCDDNIKNFFKDHNIRFDEDDYSLSEMLQWIFRSRIREDKDIDIYIPSYRMRALLKRWLDASWGDKLPKPTKELR